MAARVITSSLLDRLSQASAAHASTSRPLREARVLVVSPGGGGGLLARTALTMASRRRVPAVARSRAGAACGALE